MYRRGFSVTLLILIAVQLAGAVAFASVCFEPCPGEGDEEQDCPPVCTLCTTCTRAPQAILDATVMGTPDGVAQHVLPPQLPASPPARGDDIFHVPLAA